MGLKTGCKTWLDQPSLQAGPALFIGPKPKLEKGLDLPSVQA
jgi:hypothetical protein